ncbi:DUF2911 domain-containing protein [Reichenbachiella versicolor]|uniref:DUF2911 domain-containing protein n=1 Tax=Reichenbachiella versicolor TaxID=1821036 RepID=UPI001C88A9B5|nr:DUF2911 domain-containing protein [Reichenbachiella versicolor]
MNLIRVNKVLVLLILGIVTSYTLQAQKRASPMKYVDQSLGDVNLKIAYSSPSVKGRTIWGDLVPYDKVWRTGANEATVFEVSADCTVNGEKLKKGKYALFTIPNEKSWTVIINSVWDQWGAYKYDSSKDVLRFNVKPSQSSMTEAFTIAASEAGVVSLAWDKLKVSFEVK